MLVKDKINRKGSTSKDQALAPTWQTQGLELQGCPKGRLASRSEKPCSQLLPNCPGGDTGHRTSTDLRPASSRASWDAPPPRSGTATTSSRAAPRPQSAQANRLGACAALPSRQSSTVAHARGRELHADARSPPPGQSLGTSRWPVPEARASAQPKP